LPSSIAPQLAGACSVAVAVFACASAIPPGASESGDTSGTAGGDATESGGDDGPPALVEWADVSEPAGLRDRQMATEPVEPQCQIAVAGLDNPPQDDCHVRRFTGGAAIADFDADGWPDIFFPRFDAADALYRNRGNGTFEDVGGSAGVDSPRASSGAAWLDADGDGDLDLYVTTVGPGGHGLWIQDQGTFVDEAAVRGAALDHDGAVAGTSVLAFDYDLDGWTDLLALEWMTAALQPVGAPWQTRLLRNRGAEAPGEFEDVTMETGLDALWNGDGPTYGFSAIATDLTHDGMPDLAIASDFGEASVWRGDPGGFVRVADSGIEPVRNAMGLAAADFDVDGDLDLFVTSIGRHASQEVPGSFPFDRNWVLLGHRDGSFEAPPDALGAAQGGYGWGAVAMDLDLDGVVDVAQTNGYINDVDPLLDDAFRVDPNLMWMGRSSATGDGLIAFEDRADATGFVDHGQGRALHAIDYDRDGDMDLLEVRNHATPILHENRDASERRWLQLAPRATAEGALGRGARISIRSQAGQPWRIAEVGTGSAYLGHGEPLVSFGFADAIDRVETVRICWPVARRMQVLVDVELDQRLTLRDSDATVPISGSCADAVLE
jgi:hypothetical protein